MDTVQNRLNEENKKNPINLMNLSISAIDNEFSLKCFKNPVLEENSRIPIEKISSNHHRNLSDSINDNNHINTLPFSKYKLDMNLKNNEKIQNIKKILSKSQIIESEKEGKEITIYTKSQILNYGHKMKTTVEKRLISPLSKSINEGKDFNFLTTNNADLSREKNLNKKLF